MGFEKNKLNVVGHGVHVKDAVEKAEGRARRPKPATPQDSQELELNERKYGIGSMSLLKDEDIQRQDEDIKKAAEKKAAEEAMALGLVRVEVRVNGPGSGREAAVRALKAAGLEITKIMDVTSIPHNGCRPPKKRRV